MVKIVKTFIKSFFLMGVTSYHYFLNIFSSTREINNYIFYLKMGENKILEPLFNKKDLVIIGHSSFNLKTFFIRKVELNQISFNRVISFPYLNLTFNEKKRIRKLEEYYYKNWRIFLKHNNFKKIVLFDEYSVLPYSLIKAAKRLNITTIAMQHGIIHENHKGYIYDEKSRKKHVFPDYLLVYGNYEKRLLTEKSIWKDKSVIPLGCPRYDFLLNCQIKKSNLLERLKIPKDKKILFWPTQTHDILMSNNGENELNIEEVFNAISKNKNWFLLIKFHPNENSKKSRRLYQKYIKKFNVKRCLILEFDEISTNECIELSSAVIIKHSTVGIESILMNKAVINFQLVKSWDISQFENLKSSLIINKKNDLNIYLKKISDKKFNKLFSSEREKYIDEHFVNFGNSTREIKNFIENN